MARGKSLDVLQTKLKKAEENLNKIKVKYDAAKQEVNNIKQEIETIKMKSLIDAMNETGYSVYEVAEL